MQKLRTGQIYRNNFTRKVYAVCYNVNDNRWYFMPLACPLSIEKLYSIGGSWDTAGLVDALKQSYTLVGHLEELDIESYLEERKIE